MKRRPRLPAGLLLVFALVAGCHDPNMQLRRDVSREGVPTELDRLIGDESKLQRYGYAYGYGVAPRGLPTDDQHGRLLARSAAESNARANLVERLRGLLIRSDLLVRGLVEQEQLQGLEEQLAAKIEILQTRRNPDGLLVCLARVSLNGYIGQLSRASSLKAATRATYDPASYLNYPAVRNQRSLAALQQALVRARGDGAKPSSGPAPTWRVPGSGSTAALRDSDWPGWAGVPWFIGPFRPARGAPVQPRRQTAPPPSQLKPTATAALQRPGWPIRGLAWRREATVTGPSRYIVARPPTPVKPPRKDAATLKPLGATNDKIVRVVVLLPTPLAEGQQLVETLPAGSFPTGPVWSNGSRKTTQAGLVDRRLLIRSNGATCVAYALRGKNLLPEQVVGEVRDADRTIYQINPQSGPPPSPPAADLDSPRFLIASPPSNQLVGEQVKAIVVSGTVSDRSGLQDLQAGRTIQTLSRPQGRPPFPSTTHPRVVPFQLVLPLVKGRNQLILVARDAQGNFGAVRIVVFRE